jgi:hypothetical protein
MTKATGLSLFRTLLTLAGTYIIGHNLFGKPIDANVWQEVGAAALTAFSVGWGVLDKTATVEMVQSAIRSVLITFGGLLVAAGKLSGQSLEAIVGVGAVIVTAIQSHTSKVKIKQIASGQLTVTDKGKAAPAPPQIK